MQFKDYATWALLVVLTAGACARPGAESQEPAPAEAPDGSEPEEEQTPRRRSEPSVEPRVANLVGLMPLSSTGVDEFLLQHPTSDGRGVLIGILDSGLDLDLPGLDQTTTGEPKVLDVRDFSREGRIELEPITVTGDTVSFGGQTLSGFRRVAGLASPPYYAGIFRELPLGKIPAADINGNNNNTDEFVMLVVRTVSGWALITDVDNDGRLDDEAPIHDYGVASERFSYGLKDEQRDKPLCTHYPAILRRASITTAIWNLQSSTGSCST